MKFAKVMFSQVSVCPQGGVSVQGGLCPGGSLFRGVSLQGRSLSGRGLCPGGGLCQGDPHTVTYGQYASYWNAFLFTGAIVQVGEVFAEIQDNTFIFLYRA